MARALQQLVLASIFLAIAAGASLAEPYYFDVARLGGVNTTPNILRNSGASFKDTERFLPRPGTVPRSTW